MGTNRLPQLLAECPVYEWNDKLWMFKATLGYTSDAGEFIVTESYMISPHVYATITENMKRAWDQFEAHKGGAEVIPMRKAESG